MDKETETQKDQCIPQGQRPIGKENQKASSDWSTQVWYSCSLVTMTNQGNVL